MIRTISSPNAARLSVVLGSGVAAVALMAGQPALAQSVTYIVPAGQTTTVSTPITNIGSATTTVGVIGGGTLVLGNALNSYTGGTTATGNSTVQVDTDGELGTGGAVNLGDSSSVGKLSLTTSGFTSSRSMNLSSVGGWVLVATNNSATWNGTISGGGSLTVGGGGTLNLTPTSGANSYAGGTQIFNGSTVAVSIDAALGGGPVVLGDNNPTGATTGATTGTLSWTNTATISSARDFVLEGPTNGGVSILTNSTTGTMATTAVTLTGVISGAGNLIVGGGGNLILTGTNTYTGTTTVTGGSMLSINADAALGAIPTVTNGVASGGAVILSGGTLQFNGGFSTARTFTMATGGGSIDTDGNTDTLTGALTGTGGLTKIGTGTLILDAANNSPGSIAVNGGTLAIGDASTSTASITGPVTVGSTSTGVGTLEGIGTINGALTNVSGIVSPGTSAPGTLSVSSYTQQSTGTLSILVTPSGASTLKVGGAASLAGTLTIAYQPGFLHPGTYQIITAQSTSGWFSTINDKIPSVGLAATISQPQLVNGSEVVDLTLTQQTTLPDHPTVYTALTSAAIDEAQRTNGMLLSRMVDVRASAAVDGLTAAWTPSHRIISASPYGAWFMPTGNFGSTTSHSGSPGFDNKGFGFMTGFDGELSRGLSAGFAAGYTRTMVDEKGGASGTIDAPRVAFYGSWWTGRLAVDALLGYGYASVDGTRPISSANETAKSNHSGTEVSGAVQASLGFLVDDWSLTPAAGAKYLALDEDKFTEKGTDAYNYSVNGHYTGSLRPYVDASLSRRFMVGEQTALVPTVSVGYEEEVLSAQRRITVMTEGDDAQWRIDGTPESKGSVDVKAGLTLERDKSEGYYIDYERTQSSSTTGQTFAAGVRYRW